MDRTLIQRLHNPRNYECGCEPDCWCRRTMVGRTVKWQFHFCEIRDNRRLGQCAAGQRRVELPLSPTDAVPLGLAVASGEHLLHRIAKRRRHAPDQVGYTRS